MEPDPREQALRDALAAERDVVVAWLFGSRARGDAHRASDWDVAVKLAPCADPWRRIALGSALSAALGEPVDLIDVDRAPIELAAHAICDGRLVFERDVYERVETEARILARAHDLAPLLRWQREALLEETDHDRAVERYRATLGAAR